MKRLRIVLSLAVAALALIAGPVFAIADPDTPPVVESFNVYHNLLQPNDYLLVAYVNIPYAGPPAEPVTDAFIWRLFDDTNTVEYGTVAAYAFFNNGYNYNVVSFYFDNTTAPTWGEECFVRLEGNPTIFITPPSYNWQVAATDYTAHTATADVQGDLYNNVLSIATSLAQKWTLTSATGFLTETDIGTYLTAYGQAYFRGAIYGLQGLCPQLFPYSLTDIDITERTWTLTYANSLANQYAGTWVEDAQQAGKEFFEVDYDLTSVFLVLILAAAALIANVMLAGDAWSGMLDVSVVLIATARLGLYGMGFLGLLAALAVVYISMKVWGLGR
jgi:hypothetical protein